MTWLLSNVSWLGYGIPLPGSNHPLEPFQARQFSSRPASVPIQSTSGDKSCGDATLSSTKIARPIARIEEEGIAFGRGLTIKVVDNNTDPPFRECVLHADQF